MSIKTTAPKVRIGSVWADNSVYSRGRHIRVEAIEDDYAICLVLTNSDQVQRDLDSKAECGWPFNARDMRGGTTRIRLDRFRLAINSDYLPATHTPAITPGVQAQIERKKRQRKARRTGPAQPVTVGSYWQDAWIAGTGRVVKVMQVDDTHATIMTLVNDSHLQRILDCPNSISHPRDMRGTVRRVLLGRFRPTIKGFIPVADGPAEIARRDAEDARYREADGRVEIAMRDADYRESSIQPTYASGADDEPRVESDADDEFCMKFEHVPADETFVL